MTASQSSVSKPQHKHRFDWEEAKRLRLEGLSWSRIGKRLGVSATAVQRVCDSKTYEQMMQAAAKWQQGGICPDCGKQTTLRAGGVALRCTPCASKLRATSVRETTLHCSSCGKWKPDAAFAFNRAGRKVRRGRHNNCRPCNTIIRRDYRKRNRERERAYDRQYRRKRRAQKKALDTGHLTEVAS